MRKLGAPKFCYTLLALTLTNGEAPGAADLSREDRTIPFGRIGTEPECSFEVPVPPVTFHNARRFPELVIPTLPHPQERALPGFWPHIWAIPLLFLAGMAVGWMLRSALAASESKPGDGESRPDWDE